jgi:hypothetical protein
VEGLHALLDEPLARFRHFLFLLSPPAETRADSPPRTLTPDLALDILQNRLSHVAPGRTQQPAFQDPLRIAECFRTIPTSRQNRSTVHPYVIVTIHWSIVRPYDKSAIAKAICSEMVPLGGPQRAEQCQKFRRLCPRQLPARVRTAAESIQFYLQWNLQSLNLTNRLARQDRAQAADGKYQRGCRPSFETPPHLVSLSSGSYRRKSTRKSWYTEGVPLSLDSRRSRRYYPRF